MAPALGTFLTVDPAAVVIDANVRSDAALTPDFVESIRTNGVRQPVLAYLAEDGTVTVTDGQRRTLAAREAGLDEIPAYIVERDTAKTIDEQVIERITDQIITNDHRAALSRRDHAHAVEQLHLAGLSATKIAKALSRKKQNIEQVLTVVKSASALDTFDTSTLTLDQAAILADWEDQGDTDAVTRLLTAAESGRFDHIAHTLNNERENRAAIRAEGTKYTADGIKWVMSRPYQGGWTALGDLVYADSGTVAEHGDFPVEDTLVYLRIEEDEHWIDSTGDRVDETAIDWSLEHDDDQTTEPADGLLDPRTLTRVVERTVVEKWFVQDTHTSNLIRTWQWRQDNGGSDEPLTEEQQEQKKEQARDERRRTRELNKLAVAAEEVRHAKIADWLTRKTLPKDAAHKKAIAALITDTLWKRHDLLGVSRQMGDAKKNAATFLGLDSTDVLDTIADATADRIGLVNLAIVIGAHEAAITKDAWRTGDYRRNQIATYFTFLADVIGYTLSEVEEAMTGSLNPETIAID